MDRRDTLKTLMYSSIGSGLLLNACNPSTTDRERVEVKANGSGYGRTAEEKEHDAKIRSELPFFDDHQRALVTLLADIVIPKEGDHPSASEVGTVDFIEFMMLDYPMFQYPMLGGLRWIDYESLKRFNNSFDLISDEQRLEIVEDIAYPVDVEPEYSQGAKFFSLVRDLTGTGYFTSKEGIADLGYIGNAPNVWDGAPQDVLAKHGMDYNDKWSELYLKPEDRGRIAEWDDNKNLIG